MSEPSGRRRRRFHYRLLVAALVLVPLAGLAPAPTVAASTPVVAQVRVDQVGYASGASKRAYLMTSAPRAGAWFQVIDSHGNIAFAKVVGADQGPWSSTYSHVYA